MAERVVKDVGMMQRTQVKYRFNDPADRDGLMKAWQAFDESLPISQPGDWMGDALRRENAERCRAILATVGLSDDGKGGVDTGPLRKKGLAEDSAQWIAAFWLAAYNRLMNGRAKVAAGDFSEGVLAFMLENSEELGRLQERMWWRSGIDPETRTKREALALTGRAQVKAGKRGNEMRSSTSFAATHGIEAQAVADEIAAKNPKLSWSAIRNTVAARFEVSPETIKKSLRNPKKAG